MLRAAGVLAAASLAILAVLAFTSRAEAHALLIRSDPADGSRLSESPQEISAWFSEPLDDAASKLRVVSSDGTAIDDGQVSFDSADSTKMSIGLAEPVPPGFYQVTWDTFSRVDGHFWFGSFEFTVLNPDGSEPTGPHPAAAASSATRGNDRIAEGAITKGLGLFGAAVLIGALAAALFVLYPAANEISGERGDRVLSFTRRYLTFVALPSLMLLAIVSVAELALAARELGGATHLSQALETDWGARWKLRELTLFAMSALLVMHVAVVNLPEKTRRLSLIAAFIAGVNYLLLVSLVSHGNAVARGATWATVSELAHLATASAWIGGLVVLASALVWSAKRFDQPSRALVLASLLRRFSLVAGTSLVILFGTGLFSALTEVPTWSAMLDTAYGRALTLKLVLVIPLIGAAGLNGLLFRPRYIELAARDALIAEHLRVRLVRSVIIEAALGVAVLFAVGVLVQYAPARVAAAVAQGAQSSATPVAGRDTFGYPLAVGDWSWVVAGIFGAVAAIFWLWSPRLRLSWAAKAGAIALVLSAVALIGLNFTASPDSSAAFDASVAFRYQATDGQLVLLEIKPFQVGRNQFRVSTMKEDGQFTRPGSVVLHFSRLTQDGEVGQVAAEPSVGDSYDASFELTDTGWWAIDVAVGGDAEATYYLRLDKPSQAPLDFDPPDYASDPNAEQVFRNALTGYRNLTALKWREELTSGLLAPTGIGAWVVSDAAAETPDSVYYHVVSPGRSNYETYIVGNESCNQDEGAPWQCSPVAPSEPFELDFMDPATAFQFGRQEKVDGEMTQVVLFYNPSQPAWYAWWIGLDTGNLRRQAMVAPGHFMLTHYFDHDQPVGIQLPTEGTATGG